MTLVLTD